MIKTLLRHIIFDTCISILFGEMNKNFPQPLENADLIIGEYINVRIVVGDTNYMLQGCKVDSYDDDYTYLRYDGFDTAIILVTQDGNLIDIQGIIPDTIEEYK